MDEVSGRKPEWFGRGVVARWANSAPLNTSVKLDMPASRRVKRPVGAGLLVIVRNPSSATALAGTIEVKYTDPADGTTARWALLTSFTVQRTAGNGDGEAFLIDGGLLGDGVRINLKNSTVLGVSDAFSASVMAQSL